MIIDFHTHIFPPDVRENRDAYLRRDATFAEMYSDPKAKIADAGELLESMDAAGVDVSVALGFAWRSPEDCARHNDYLLEAAAESGGRIVPFCTANLASPDWLREVEHCAAAGARGLGELRPDSQGWALDGLLGEELLSLAEEKGLALLFHVTEEGGHRYPGKAGLRLDTFRRFLSMAAGRGVAIIGAHLAGGLPLTDDSPDDSLYADTAALKYLYEPSVLQRAAAALPGRLLFGSDFPLVSQASDIDRLRGSGLDEEALRSLLGGAAAKLLGIDAPAG